MRDEQDMEAAEKIDPKTKAEIWAFDAIASMSIVLDKDYPIGIKELAFSIQEMARTIQELQFYDGRLGEPHTRTGTRASNGPAPSGPRPEPPPAPPKASGESAYVDGKWVGWPCPTSPTGRCQYFKYTPDECDHCGQPEERK